MSGCATCMRRRTSGPGPAHHRLAGAEM